MTAAHSPLVSVVVIGRNEGRRLLDCLRSVYAVDQAGFRLETIYVDSASTDGSARRARTEGARVIELQPQRPCAAIGRNAGWQAARGEYVLFLDGDTVLHPAFPGKALAAIAARCVAVVWGHRRERNPGQSVYTRVLDLDWVYPPGESAFCGGDALVRRSALEQVGGFDETLIAGEEPELCRRLRAQGHRIVHIDEPMTTHDLAITRPGAYWRRALRAGHAYAEVADRFRASDDPLWLADARRNRVHGAAVLAAPLLLTAAALTQPLLAGAIAAGGVGLLARSARRCAWKTPDTGTRWMYALHSHVQQVPILFGQASWYLNRRRGRRRALIEYKQRAAS